MCRMEFEFCALLRHCIVYDHVWDSVTDAQFLGFLAFFFFLIYLFLFIYLKKKNCVLVSFQTPFVFSLSPVFFAPILVPQLHPLLASSPSPCSAQAARTPQAPFPAPIMPSHPTTPTHIARCSSALQPTRPTANQALHCRPRPRWSGHPLSTASKRTPGEQKPPFRIDWRLVILLHAYTLDNINEMPNSTSYKSLYSLINSLSDCLEVTAKWNVTTARRILALVVSAIWDESVS